LRYFKTDSSGANSSGTSGYKISGYTEGNDGEIDNRTWSAALIYTVGGHGFTAGYQSVSSGSNFTQLNQGGLANKGAGGSSLYLYTDRLIQTFTRAGERTAFGQYAYDFAAMGVPGLKAYRQCTSAATTSRRPLAIPRRNGSGTLPWTT